MDPQSDTTIEPKIDKTFSEAEVEKMLKDRRARDAENLRLQHEENKRLKSKADELESKLADLERKNQKGTATTDEMTQLQTAKTAATQGQAQGYSPEQMQDYVEMAMQQKELEAKLVNAKEKDPEFAKLLENGNKLYQEEVVGTAYLPNAPAVVKHLMKDKKSLELYRTAIRNYSRDGGVAAMTVLNNLSDKLSDGQEKAQPSQYRPAEELSDSSDDEQNFDEKDYISSKY